MTTVRELLPLDQYIIHDVSDDFISANGVERLESLLSSTYYENEEGYTRLLPSLPRDWDYSWLVRSGEYRGKIANRIETYYKKEHGIKLPAKIKASIGSTLSDNRVVKGTYYFDFTDMFEWEAGDFGDGGSCFWGGRQSDKWSLHAYGALAIRMYTDDTFENGIGRAWLIPDEGNVGKPSVLVFNGYWKHQSSPNQQIASILAHFLGMQLRNIRITNNQEADDSIYFNGAGSAILVAPQSVLQDYTYKKGNTYNPFPTIDFHIPTNIVGRCEYTKEYLYEDDFIHTYERKQYGRTAYDLLFGRCEISNAMVLKTDLRELPDGRKVHINEYNKLLTPCQVCKERHQENDLHWLEGSSVRICNDCYEHRTVIDVHTGERCMEDTTCIINENGDRVNLSTGFWFSQSLDDNLQVWVRDLFPQDTIWLSEVGIAHNVEEVQGASIEDIKLAICDALLTDAISYVDLNKNISQEVAYGFVGYFNITALAEGMA